MWRHSRRWTTFRVSLRSSRGISSHERRRRPKNSELCSCSSCWCARCRTDRGPHFPCRRSTFCRAIDGGYSRISSPIHRSTSYIAIVRGFVRAANRWGEIAFIGNRFSLPTGVIFEAFLAVLGGVETVVYHDDRARCLLYLQFHLDPLFAFERGRYFLADLDFDIAKVQHRPRLRQVDTTVDVDVTRGDHLTHGLLCLCYLFCGL